MTPNIAPHDCEPLTWPYHDGGHAALDLGDDTGPDDLGSLWLDLGVGG